MICLHIFDVVDFSWDVVYVYSIFWETLQILQRGVITFEKK